LKPISTAAPTHIIKTLMNQKQATSMLGIHTQRKFSGTGRWWQSTALILHLPNQPMGRQDSPNAELFLGVFGVAMTHSIHQRFV
jgi:hypothetical protein